MGKRVRAIRDVFAVEKPAISPQPLQMDPSSVDMALLPDRGWHCLPVSLARLLELVWLMPVAVCAVGHVGSNPFDSIPLSSGGGRSKI